MVFILLCASNLAPVLAKTGLPEVPLSEKRILILYSYFASTPAYVAMTTPMLSALIDAGVSADNLNQEFLDLGRHADPLYRKYLREFLKSKYVGVKFDLIVTVHGAAQQFVLEEVEAVWPQVQCLSLLAPGIPPPGKIGRSTGVILLSPDFRGTLERALEMFPQTKRVLFATGSGPPEMKYIEQAKVAFEPWQGKLAFEYTDGRSLEQILKRVANLPPGTIVLASALITDGRGANLIVAEAIRGIAEAANAPVFSFFDSVIGTGVVGGSMVIFDQAGTYAGKLVLDILNAKISLTDPPSVLPSQPPVPLFDWPQIERWKGDATRLPENSVFLRRPPTLWEQHKAAALGTLAALLVLTGFISLLLAQLRNRKRQESLIAANNALLQRKNSELEATLNRIKRLEGMLSICMQCKKIRTENNDWHQFEQYIVEHSDAVFSHGLCPDCLDKKLKDLG